MLEEDAARGGPNVLESAREQRFRGQQSSLVRTDAEGFGAPVLVVATGGLSIPKIGATSLWIRSCAAVWSEDQKTRPALVPLTFPPKEKKQYCDLAGVSMEVIARAGECAFRGKMLGDARGLSGPAILQASSYWEPGKPLTMAST